LLNLSTKAVSQVPLTSCNQQSKSYVSSSRDGSKAVFGGSISGGGGYGAFTIRGAILTVSPGSISRVARLPLAMATYSPLALE